MYKDPTGHWKQGDEKLTQTARVEISRLTDLYYKATTDAERNAIGQKANEIRNDKSNIATTKQNSVTATAYNNLIAKNGGNDLTAQQWNSISTTKNDSIVKSTLKDGKITASELNSIVPTKPSVINSQNNNSSSTIGYNRDAAVEYANKKRQSGWFHFVS